MIFYRHIAVAFVFMLSEIYAFLGLIHYLDQDFVKITDSDLMRVFKILFIMQGLFLALLRLSEITFYKIIFQKVGQLFIAL